MSTPPSRQSPPPNKPRKKRPAEEVSFEDLLAAHTTERRPGQLPAEGVVLIGVDVELQRRMAENLPRPSPPPESTPSTEIAPKIDAHEKSSAESPLDLGPAPSDPALAA